MFAPGEIISYVEMCSEEGENLQRGMNYRTSHRPSVILMSRRPGAPYDDRIEADGHVLIYEGHNTPRTANGPDPKTLDQPERRPSGALTENGLFLQAALRHRQSGEPAELVRVYEKMREGIWTFNGTFLLMDGWREQSKGRQVFKFRLETDPGATPVVDLREPRLEQNRLIPREVKLAVWKRDRGKCVECGSSQNLHFDHIIPYSRGGSSLVTENIQLLCARHNLAKHDSIQ
ncbi:HNH endonuclease [Mycobacterium sp. IS-836]|uniref:HNH endonuclease n=1 Tax=Mycobacterium sp. IS-836 TaxID=1834160 RepID=UPI001E3C76AE|nr:HNH endonuclease [Mycobacterium sp. IS-836]